MEKVTLKWKLGSLEKHNLKIVLLMYDQKIWQSIDERDDMEIAITLPLDRAEKLQAALKNHRNTLDLVDT
jgi:hypothetical protein